MANDRCTALPEPLKQARVSCREGDYRRAIACYRRVRSLCLQNPKLSDQVDQELALVRSILKSLEQAPVLEDRRRVTGCARLFTEPSRAPPSRERPGASASSDTGAVSPGDTYSIPRPSPQPSSPDHESPPSPDPSDDPLRPQSPVRFNPRIASDRELSDVLEHNMLDRDPGVHWNSIAGLHQAKKILEETLILPKLMPGFFRGIRRPWRGILLFGPPGTGKTLLAKAVASLCGMTFFNVSASTLTSKWYGVGEKMIRVLFEMAAFYAPSVVFLDEIDALCSRAGATESEASRRMKAEFLTRLDGVSQGVEDASHVMVLAATNLPWMLDEAMIRRLEKRVYIGLPDEEARRQLLALSLAEIPCDRDVDMDSLARQLEGYSGADINNICRDACMMGLRRTIGGLDQEQIKTLQPEDLNTPVTSTDFRESLENIKSSVDPNTIQHYEEWDQQFKST